MGVSPPPPKWPFFAHKRHKNATLGQNQCFLGLNGQFKAPHPISQVPDSNKYVLQVLRDAKRVIQGRPPTKKMAIFCPKKGLKMPILGRKQCFFGLGWPVEGLQPYFAGAQLQKMCVAGFQRRKTGDSAPPPNK